MIQFLGLDMSTDAVHAVVLGRDLRVTLEKLAPVVNVRRDASGPGATLAPAEWTRAGHYVLQEVYLGLPVRLRKLWGVGLSGPAGWIALDIEYEPLSELRFVPARDIAADFAAWLDTDPRLARRIAAFLSPKDYFRFTLSRALAADATLASRQGLLAEGQLRWSAARIGSTRIAPEWLPPVFDATVKTGQIGPAGIEKTGIPGGLWIVAGALSACCAQAASCDLRGQRIWAARSRGIIASAADAAGAAAPPGFERVLGPYAGAAVDERELASGEDFEAAVGQAASGLELAGRGAAEVVRHEAPAGLGAAAMAAVGSGLVRSWDALYRGAHFLPAPDGSLPRS